MVSASSSTLTISLTEWLVLADSSGVNTTLLCCTQPPYGQGQAHAALDVALAFAAFDQAISLLFLDQGVLQLLSAQQSEFIGQKNIAKILSSLSLYGIEHVYADEQAMNRLGLTADKCVVDVKLLDQAQIHQLHDSASVILNF